MLIVRVPEWNRKKKYHQKADLANLFVELKIDKFICRTESFKALITLMKSKLACKINPQPPSFLAS
jgi:hypothetical protein